MNLFQTLYAYRRGNSLENYFTLIVSHLLDAYPDLLREWINQVVPPAGGDCERFTAYEVSPQRYLCGSYADIVIELSKGTRREVLLIESKVDAGEDEGQLPKYAGLLVSEFPRAQQRTLVYITRDYDPKDKQEVLKGVEDKVGFIQLRWFNFYDFLVAYQETLPSNPLFQETIRFMDEKLLGHIRSLTPAEYGAMPHVLSLIQTMKTTLSEEVKEKFVGITGEKRAQPDLAPDWGNFMLCTNDHEPYWLGLGFELGGEDGCPRVFAYFCSLPSSSRPKWLLVAQRLIEKGGWEASEWDGVKPETVEPESWAGAYYPKNLADFLTEPESVAQIKKFFLDRLSEIAEVKRAHPRLAWKK